MKVLDNLTLNIKLNIMGILIVLSVISLGFFSYYLINVSKIKIDEIYKNRVVTIVELENIKDIYNINFLDTLKELKNNNINAQDTRDVILVAKELVQKSLHSISELNLTEEEKDIFYEIQEKVDSTNVLIDIILLHLYKNENDIVFEKYYENLQSIINECRFSISSLVELELKLAKNDKINLDTRYSQLYIFLIFSVVFISILSYLISIPIKNSINALNKSLKDTNEQLLKNYEIIDKYVILSQTDKNGIITDISEAFCKISGYEKSELIGKSHNIIKSKDTTKEFFDEFWHNLKDKQIWHSEIKNRKKDGTKYWLYLNVTPILDNKNNIIGYISINRDITDKKIIQEQQKQLLQQSRHAAMGEMISMIAHQWRQPLSTINAIISNNRISIQLGTLDNNELEKSFSEISNLTSYLSTTIEDFRNFFKPNKRIEEITINDILTSSIKLINHSIKNLDINIKIVSNDDITIYTYKNELIQVIINILKNAVDELVKKDDLKEIIISFFKEENFCKINIIDNAGGINNDIIDKIFEPYFSTKSKNGTGLGLYMSKIIVNEHLNGEISVQNLNDGAKFTIKLPIKGNYE